MSFEKGQVVDIKGADGKARAATIVDVKAKGRGHTVTFKHRGEAEQSLSASKFAALAV